MFLPTTALNSENINAYFIFGTNTSKNKIKFSVFTLKSNLHRTKPYNLNHIRHFISPLSLIHITFFKFNTVSLCIFSLIKTKKIRYLKEIYNLTKHIFRRITIRSIVIWIWNLCRFCFLLFPFLKDGDRYHAEGNT